MALVGMQGKVRPKAHYVDLENSMAMLFIMIEELGHLSAHMDVPCFYWIKIASCAPYWG